MVRVLRCTHPNFAHTRQNLSLLYICDLHSNRTGSLKEDIKLEDFLKLNDPPLYALFACVLTYLDLQLVVTQFYRRYVAQLSQLKKNRGKFKIYRSDRSLASDVPLQLLRLFQHPIPVALVPRMHYLA